MLTLIIFIIVLSVLVFVHELGHFWVAKRAGMKVEEFGFGFPPRLLAWRRRPAAEVEPAFGNETTFSINLIPFGGFVKILGEDGGEITDPRSFAAAKPGVRAAVIVAGVAMNLLLAIVLLSIGNAVGLRVGLADEAARNRATDIKIQIAQVAEASPAQEAGLRLLDEISAITVSGQRLTVGEISEVQNIINSNRGREITLEIKRGSETLPILVIPRANPPPNEGAIGISLALTGIVEYPWHQAVSQGIQNTFFITRETIAGYGTILRNLFITGKAGVELSGPVGIAVITGQAARLGFIYLLQLVSLISINLAVLNAAPFPALDGGRLLFVVIEKLKGRPVSKKIETAVNAAGFALLIALMILVTAKDIIKFL